MSEEAETEIRQVVVPVGYGGLFDALASAFSQAVSGKGYERHGEDGIPFENQPIFWIADQFGDGFLDGQVVKKVHEARRLPPVRAIAEREGAIIYLAVRNMREKAAMGEKA